MKTPPPSPKKSAAKAKAPARKKPAPESKPARKSAALKTVRAKTPADALRLRVEKVRQILDGKKGENIVLLRVTDVSSVTDYLILCNGLNIPHLRALADEVVKQLRLENPPVTPHRHAGSSESEWFVLDYIDFVVHLFTPSMRAYYALEQLWKDAPVVR